MTLFLDTQQWLLNAGKGQQLLSDEQFFFQAACSHQIIKNRVLVVGCAACSLNLRLPESVQILRQDVYGRHIDVWSLPEHSPWQSACFDVVLASHIAEYVETPAVLFTEWWRISKPQASLLITVFNPNSCWNKLPELPRLCHDMGNLIETAESVGWRLEQCRFIRHLPLFRQPKLSQYWRWIEKVVSLLLPNSALVYGLVLTKQEYGCTPLSETIFQAIEPELGQFALSREMNDLK
ncbi:MAG: methyltransferase domain-containing protein [Alysiella sp.]|uniref:methyltransferase domain-containing protein n=1 Tax=Alysiella sp. TaxID=1872483 RepID=UPI0026DCF9E0|nr:methyltransferase domain-containing protein [Alysiella sp.]MDO4433815.1 methyltransferase domain-containing protein [Alysiella sp.]